MRYLATLLLAVFICNPAQAGLSFTKKAIDAEAGPADDTVTVDFIFENKGEKAVTIKDITFACSCLAANADKKSYAAGEKGKINAVFKLGSFTGVQRKSLTVVAEEEGAEEATRHSLTFGVTIPDVITIEPELLQWAVGDEPEEKSFTFKVPYDKPVNIKEITCSRTGWDFELVVKKAGREYEIKLKPTSTEAPMLGLLKIETDCEIAKHQKKMAFFSIARQRRK